MLRFENLEFLSDTGRIVDDGPFIFWKIKANFHIFNVEPDQIVKSTINRWVVCFPKVSSCDNLCIQDWERILWLHPCQLHWCDNQIWRKLWSKNNKRNLFLAFSWRCNHLQSQILCADTEIYRWHYRFWCCFSLENVTKVFNYRCLSFFYKSIIDICKLTFHSNLIPCASGNSFE